MLRYVSVRKHSIQTVGFNNFSTLDRFSSDALAAVKFR
ncbi:hypothetical protein CKA32_000131 [Geitlerinema sp. FC II]|nr:hypothetical protein CKA32_000131 [Geitlerinema sp. FC II]